MSTYTFVSIRFPGLLRSSFGHWLFWAALRIGRHVAETRKAFEDAMK